MIEVRPSRPSDADDLLAIWKAAVDASHDFLAPDDRVAIEPFVSDYVRTAPLLVATLDGSPFAFMGVTDQNVDSLFVDPRAQGRGVGRMLIERVARPVTVDVNEQNRGALRFYEHLGFGVVGRSPLDDQGRPYRLLHLRRD